MQKPLTIETKSGTLEYTVVPKLDGFAGRVRHDLHRHTKLNGKVLTRYSKVYKTYRGAEAWVEKEYLVQYDHSLKS